MHKAIRLIMIAVVIFSAPTFGQQARVGLIPLDRRAGSTLDDDSGEGFRSQYDQLERIFTKSELPSESWHELSAGTVSVEQLRHPLSEKGERLILNGQRFAKAGDHAKAIDEFREALNERTSMPYAHGLLGAEYLKEGNATAAEVELSEAVLLMPGIGANHSNLGCAYLLMGKRNAAERELREPIRLDHTSPQPRYLLGLLLLDQGAPEAAKCLSFAQTLLRNARLALAIFHIRNGQSDAAEQDLHAYLGPEWTARGAGAEAWIRAAAGMERPSALFGLPAGGQ